MTGKAEQRTDAQEREFPLVRPLEGIPVSIMGQTMFLVRDPARVSHKSLMLTPMTYFLVSMFDGKTSMRDIQLAYSRKFGNLIFTDQILDLIFELDCALMMNNSRYRQYLEFLREEFDRSNVRECILKGDDYPDDPGELKKKLDSFYDGLSPDPFDGVSPLGVAAPHIDFNRGGPVYAESYRQIKKSDCDTFVVFGTSHQPMENLAALTAKSYNTPLGEIPCHKDMAEQLARHSTYDLFADEFNHRAEHSIEFQAVMLRHAFPHRDIKILPILTGSLDYLGREGRPPAVDVKVRDFVEAMRKTLDQADTKVCFIAGVDLSHTGPHFGDEDPPTAMDLEQLKETERQDLKHLEEGCPDSFFNSIISRQKTRRVCGLSSLYLAGRSMAPFRGTLLNYQVCSDSQRNNNVSIASMAFHPWNDTD